MAINTRFETVADATYSAAAAATALAETITWSSNEPSVSYTYTIADGDAVTSTETGQSLKTHSTQINALITDLAAIRAAQVQIAADNAAMLAALNAD
jgi:hypothetical protein